MKMKTRKNKKERALKLRILIVCLGFAVFASMIVARAYNLHLAPNPKLKKWAERSYQKFIELSPKRGDILDARNRSLAASLSVKSVYANPMVVKEKDMVANRLSRILKIRKSALLKKLKSRRYFVWVKRKISPDICKKIRDLDIKGIGFLQENKRFYPNVELASGVLGFTGVDSNGLSGIELEYEEYLRSKKSSYSGLKDALGRTLLTEGVFIKEFARGNDLHLTIDRTIQYIAETELDTEMAASKAKRGYAIVMDPNTGKILAMVSRPRFNPNNYSRFRPESWTNGTISLTYEPGSTLKVFVIAAALEAGIIDPKDLFYCKEGSFTVAGKLIRDSSDKGWLTPSSIIKFSSNIGAAKIAMQMGPEKLHGWLKRFGFGETTGVDLPGESRGILRDHKTWSSVGLANIGFGQGIAITPLQLVTALSVIANGGRKVLPHVVEKIVNQKNNAIFTQSLEPGKRVISKATAEMVRNFMIGVTESEGTGQRARLEGFKVAGKTGTAQKIDPLTGNYSSDATVVSFMGFVPANDPKLTIAVIIDEPGESSFGGIIAAPVFKKIAQKTLKYLKIIPDELQTLKLAERYEEDLKEESNPFRLASGDSRADRNKKFDLQNSGLIPDFEGLSIREVLKIAQKKKIKVSVKGSGVSYMQKPGAGAKISKKNSCTVYFRPI